MADEWAETTLGECATWLSGGTPFKGNDAFWSGAIPWVSAKDMKSFRLHDAEDHISPLAIGNGGKVVPGGTILLLVRGMTLHNDVPICMLTREMAFNQDIKALRPANNVDGAFLAYWLLAHKPDLLASVDHAGHGTGRLVTGTLKEKVVYLPPLAEQKTIAAVLGALDDKIELNRRMNATLEAMARALFQSWFVDFDPVRAKLDGRQPTGLGSATTALFPAIFQDSALGYVPYGWRVVNVGETCRSIFSGGTPSTQAAHFWGGNIPWLSSGETRNHYVIDTDKTITEAGVSNSSTRVARAGCTVIAGAGQGHTRGQTSLLTLDSYINQSVVALDANPQVSSDLFLFFDLARRYEEFRQLSDSHSSRGSLTTKLLAGVKVVLPPPELVATFDKAVDPLVARITANLYQSRTLAHLRDALLPKLLSGVRRGPERPVDSSGNTVNQTNSTTG